MRIGKGKLNAQRKPAPLPFCPPEIPHDLTWDRTFVVALESQTNHLSYGMALSQLQLQRCQTEVHTAEPSPFEIQIALVKWKKCILPGIDQIPSGLTQTGGERFSETEYFCLE
jgi:hypothetical protein